MNRKLLMASTLGALAAVSLSIAIAQQPAQQRLPAPAPTQTVVSTHSMPHYGVKTNFALIPAGGIYTRDMIKMTVKHVDFPPRWDETDGSLLSSGTQDPRTPDNGTLYLGSDVYDLTATSSGVMTLVLPKSDYEQFGQSFELDVYDASGALIQGVGPIWYAFF